jgi:hypothetical protein
MGKIEKFDFKELAAILVKERKIHSGHWGVFLRFGIAAGNVNMQPEDTTAEGLYPTALVPIIEIGLQQFAEPNNLSVDAAKVNPEKKRRS